MSKPLTVNGQPIGNGKEPLLCLPLLAKTESSMRQELATLLPKQPDLLEWRVDFFEGISDLSRVLAMAGEIRQATRGLPLIFTRRSTREGGQPIALSEAQVLTMYQALSAARLADFYDYELSGEPAHFQAARAAIQQSGAQLIASFHDFQQTPPAATLLAKFIAMEQAGADIVKIAVMPQAIDDVLTLLSATLAAHRQLKSPIISMSMGGYGSLSRLFGWAFGSSLSFAVGAESSAPGQIPVDDLRQVLTIAQRAFHGDSLL